MNGYLASVDIRLLAGRRAAARRMPARGGAPELVGLDLMPRDGHRDGIWRRSARPEEGGRDRGWNVACYTGVQLDTMGSRCTFSNQTALVQRVVQPSSCS